MYLPESVILSSLSLKIYPALRPENNLQRGMLEVALSFILNKPGLQMASPPTRHATGIALVLCRTTLPELYFVALPSAFVDNHKEQPCARCLCVCCMDVIETIHLYVIKAVSSP